jgi:hypothetical protein
MSMRRLNPQDYVLIGTVILSGIAGILALMAGVLKLWADMREHSAHRLRAEASSVPDGPPEKFRRGK